MSDQEKSKGIIVPPEKISPDALDALIEEFVLRNGTDYGSQEVTLDTKKKQIRLQINSHEIFILFDPQLENTNLLTKNDVKKLSLQNFEILGLPVSL